MGKGVKDSSFSHYVIKNPILELNVLVINHLIIELFTLFVGQTSRPTNSLWVGFPLEFPMGFQSDSFWFLSKITSVVEMTSVTLSKFHTAKPQT